jgi:serralysin
VGFDLDEILIGGAGNDVLNGDLGRDRLYGGSREDVFVFKPMMGVDEIYDFDPAEDHIDLLGFKFSDLVITQYGTDSTDIRGPNGVRVT